jgi:hypothetical protein
MPCKQPLESYPPPDKRKTPRISSDFLKRKQKQIMRKSTVVDKFISLQVDLVSRTNISEMINELTSFHNRHTKSQYINDAAEWITKKLKAFDGNNDDDNNNVYYHEYTVEPYKLKNVIYDKHGATNKILLFCAHYDTILQRDFEDSISRAPGADDNASGVSALLEASRIISHLNFEYSIRFVFFSGEEQGLWGSKYYAQYVKDRNEDLYAVVNMDMCAEPGFLETTNNNTTNVDVDDGTTGSVSTNNEASQILGQKMEQMAKDYTNLSVVNQWPIDSSDYMPFEARGYVCLGAYDGSAVNRNHHYHSDTDIPSNLDIDLLTSTTKMVLAFALSEGRVRQSNL